MRKLVIVSMVFAMMALCSTAMAQVKIATVDIQRCLQESDAGKKANQELKDLEADRSGKVQKLREEVAKMQKDFIEQEKALSDAAKKTRAEELQKKAGEFEATARKYSMELQQKEAELTSKIMKDIEGVIAGVAKTDKYDFVIYAQAMAYASSSVDITQKVIDQYNKQSK